MRELKLGDQVNIQRWRDCRTLPRVRELKRFVSPARFRGGCSRTLPRVRELKHGRGVGTQQGKVAPFPGCVN